MTTEDKIYNKKEFLLPDSIWSMACYHAKVMDDKMMKLTIHDCRGSIQLWNDLDEPEQVNEAINKLEVLAFGISELREFIIRNYKTKKTTATTMEKETIRVKIIATPEELEEVDLPVSLSGAIQKAWDYGFDYMGNGSLWAKFENEYHETEYWVAPVNYLETLIEIDK